MTDEELIAELRRISRPLLGRAGDQVARYGGGLMKEAADRLEARPAPQASVWAFCKRCEAGTASATCPECGVPGAACAVCGRCPQCDGDLPGEEDSEAE